MQIGSRIQQLRKKQGWSQGELAEKLNVSRQTVSKWELAEALPDTENVIKLCRLFSVSADALLQPDVAPSANTNVGVSKKPSSKRHLHVGIALLLIGVFIIGTLVTLSQIIPSQKRVYVQYTEADTRISGEEGELPSVAADSEEFREIYSYIETTEFFPFLNTYALHWLFAVGLGCILTGICFLMKYKRQIVPKKPQE